jgi:hypothetical protein
MLLSQSFGKIYFESGVRLVSCAGQSGGGESGAA